MPRRIAQIILSSIFLVSTLYLLFPGPGFPPPPPSAVVSTEPADTESIYRQAYYSNLSRSEIIDYYKNVFRFSPFFSLPLPQLRINHPPEEAYTLIRDQTRSSWLEELTHPWRESVYINGFYPTKPTEQITVSGIPYQNKITLHYLPSYPITRITVLLLTSICCYIFYRSLYHD